MDNILTLCLSGAGFLFLDLLSGFSQKVQKCTKIILMLLLLLAGIAVYLYHNVWQAATKDSSVNFDEDSRIYTTVLRSLDLKADEIETLQTENITLSRDYSILRMSCDAAVKIAEEQIVSLNEQLYTALKSIDLQQKKYTDLAAEFQQKNVDELSLKKSLLSSEITIAILRDKNNEEIAKTARLENMLAAAQDNYDEALRTLFFSYKDGVSLDSKKSYYIKAFDFFQEKADFGSKTAQYLVGYMLDPWYKNIAKDISGIEQSADEAMIAYKKISDDKNAQFCIGRLYYYEYDYQNKDEKAAEWLLKSAYQGHEGAQFLLGYMEGKKQIKPVNVPLYIPDAGKFWDNLERGREAANNE